MKDFLIDILIAMVGLTLLAILVPHGEPKAPVATFELPVSWCQLEEDLMTPDGLIWSEGERVPCIWLKTERSA
jgi:hypothetical protein